MRKGEAAGSEDKYKFKEPRVGAGTGFDAGSARPLLVAWQHCAMFAPLALRSGWMALETTAHHKLPFRTQEQIDVFLSLSPEPYLSVVYQSA